MRQGMAPAAFVLLYFTLSLGEDKAWSYDVEDDAAMLAAALKIRLREVLREQMSGVYGVSASSNITRWPRLQATSYVAFGCSPDNVPALKKAVLDVVAEVQAKGVPKEVVEKIQQGRKRAYEERLKSNGFWLGKLKTHLWMQTDPAEILRTEHRVKRVSSAQIRATAKQLLRPGKFVFAQLLPEKTPEKLPAKTPAKTPPSK